MKTVDYYKVILISDSRLWVWYFFEFVNDLVYRFVQVWLIEERKTNVYYTLKILNSVLCNN